MSALGDSTTPCNTTRRWRVCAACLASLALVGCGFRETPVSSAGAADVGATPNPESDSPKTGGGEAAKSNSAAVFVDDVADREDSSATLPAAALKPIDGAADKEKEYVTATLRGQVVWMYPTLKDRYGMGAVREAAERVLALESDDGNLYPLFEDARGRAFRIDARLRERPVELMVRWRPQAHMIQVVRLWFVEPDGRYLVDYWCDVCAISMIEDGPCDCCQEHNRLRERPD